MVRRPSIVVNGFGTLPEEEDDDERPPSAISSSSSSPLTPAQRYPGWMYEVVRPLEEFIDDVPDPRELYVDLQEIAEGDSGSVFSARQVNTPLGSPTFVAIKQVAILPSGSQKLRDLERELVLLKRVRHQNVLGMDALHVDLVEDTLWIQMELMERSLADVIALFEEGITLQEKVMARFASDAISALDYLHSLKIAHRDVRSDNMLLNIDGVLKLCDFSNAVQVTPQAPTCTDVVGVIYWQAPEMRAGPYDALKVDTWSLGATVWEMVQGEPPFSEVEDPRQIGDQWPSLRQPELYSRSFHDFLHLSSLPSVSRPDPGALSKTPFIRSACPRSVVVQVLSDCRTIEERMHKRLSVDSQGTISS
ncbi:hypothetical protein JAAARDRAFT_133058 [Jaapia argillacea MUCL 33604]|uniref:Protein kinase domain-containing protein n=1 Tax=Jaapia argillacea MUCL 33604 TaxID=933084 RepID=A0A067PQ18_9AGAM|nr:hypothetical protein JAAARDRAFT_133058 [Jaapia argillacea MUCL 33604]